MKAAMPAVHVGRARLANARPGDRERLSAALGLASPAATGIGERALLLIRRMQMERPLRVSGGERFAGELIDRIRAAKVAARRGLSATGDSVYFKDEIALEVAIVRAWLTGDRLPAVVLETVSGSATPIVRWRRFLFQDLRLLPRLVTTLVEADLAAPWFARFSDGELAFAVETLLRSHGIATMPSSPKPGATLDPRESSPRRHLAPPSTIPAVIAKAIALAEKVSSREKVRIFIAACLVAVRRPALMSTRVLGTALADMARAPETMRAPSLGGPIATVLPLMSAAQPIATAPQDRIQAPPGVVSLPMAAHGNRPVTFESSPTSLPVEVPGDAGEQRTVTSDYAGLFFFLNVFLALGLYGDFTDPERRLRGLSPFELLLLLGRRWLGSRLCDGSTELVLRGLAGLGPRERAGRYFEARVWRVPSAWLAPWPRRRARMVPMRGGVSHWHHAGFPIADRSKVRHSAAWLRRRWVACLGRYIEARTIAALGAGDARTAIATVVQSRGAISIDSERVDVEFALNDHPLAVRLAGLDRDPGWIPAAGRSIRLHFT